MYNLSKTKMFGGKRYQIAGTGKDQISRGKGALVKWG